MTFNKEEMKSLGVFGIYKESYKIITSWSKIFLQIALVFILPTYLINYANKQISNEVFANTILNQAAIATTTTTTFNQTQLDTVNGTALPPYNPYFNLFSSEYASFWLFEAACIIAGVIFSLFSKSAGIYAVARIHTGQEVTFKKVVSVVPKVWKRLMVTFLCTFVAFAAYTTLIMFMVLVIVFMMIRSSNSTYAGLITGSLVTYVVKVVYLVGSVYMTLVWQLANVVSVLEDVRGFKAMKKSKELLKRNMWVAIIAPFILSIVSGVVGYAFEKLVMNGWYLGTVDRVGYEIVCSMLFIVLNLFELVMETVLYLVCKSYHNENVDKLSLSDHLDHVYVLGDYVPLETDDNVQLEKFNYV